MLFRSKVQYIDGTKIESVANKYTFVWRGSVEKYDARLKVKTDALLRQIEQNHAVENQENPVSEELTAEEVAERVERIRENRWPAPTAALKESGSRSGKISLHLRRKQTSWPKKWAITTRVSAGSLIPITRTPESRSIPHACGLIISGSG